MNTVRGKRFRHHVTGMVLAIGLAVTTASCGGGSNGTIVPPPPPPPPAGPTAAITVANGHDVASVVFLAVGASFNLGDITGGQVNPQASGAMTALMGPIDIGGLLGKPNAGSVQKVENCANGGTADVTAVLADPNTLTIGDRITAVFDSCDDNDGYVISGEMELTVTAIEGDFMSTAFLLGFDVLMTDISVSQGAETVITNGDFNLTMDNLAFPVISLTLAGGELQFGVAGTVYTVTDFDHFLEANLGLTPQTMLAEVVGRLGSAVLGGTVDYETTTAIQGSGDNDPYTGEILVTGANDSAVRIVIIDSAHISLEIDENGDGVVDAYVDTTWAALNGQTSTINSSSAPGIAREVVAGVTGFGSLSVAPGGQFVPTAPFGQIKAQAVSGDFGPQTLNCFTSGTANVAGFIDTAGTYGADDLLAASYATCRHGGEILDGQMDLTVNSFVEKPGDAFQLTATVVDSALLRDAGGNVFTGTGTIDVSHDMAYTTNGVTYMTGSATTFMIGSDNVDRQLSMPTVSAEISIGQVPVTISRTSSGSITSPALDGSFVYASIVADTFDFDADPNTGPYSGELLVTASDDSTLHIVAIDELNVRLEIDLDGDSVIDATIDTTWGALQ